MLVEAGGVDIEGSSKNHAQFKIRDFCLHLKKGIYFILKGNINQSLFSDVFWICFVFFAAQRCCSLLPAPCFCLNTVLFGEICLIQCLLTLGWWWTMLFTCAKPSSVPFLRNVKVSMSTFFYNFHPEFHTKTCPAYNIVWTDSSQFWQSYIQFFLALK